jgi:gliding-associated putative ABC transporter substrate-binding component GldG
VSDTRRTLLVNATLQMALVVVIVVLANLVAQRHPVRVDLTAAQVNSLDDGTVTLLGRLERPLVVKAYVSSGLQAPYGEHERAVRDLLEEMASRADGRMRVSVVDPGDDAERVAEAKALGLQPLEYTVREADRAELRKVWMGASLMYGDRQETLPVLTDLSSLEYDVASALQRLVAPRPGPVVVGYTVGRGEPDLGKVEGPIRGMMEQLARRYALRPLQLGGAGGIPEDVRAVLVVGPQRPWSDRALYQLDQFVMRGGAAGLFLTNTRPDMQTLRTGRVSGGLEPLVGQYGVRVNRDLVVDRVQNGLMRFPVRAGNATGFREINYPLLPRSTDLERGSPLVRGLEELLFPFAATLGVPETLPPGVSVQVLARTSPSAGSVGSVPSANPNDLKAVLPDERRGPFPLLVAVTGPQRSFFETRGVPPADPEAPATNEADPSEPARIAEGASTRLVVGGSADFVANNTGFMLNLVDWLVQDEALIGIRGKKAQLSPLAPTTGAEQVAWRLGAMLLGPLVLFGAGLARAGWLRRRAAAHARSLAGRAARTEAP